LELEREGESPRGLLPRGNRAAKSRYRGKVRRVTSLTRAGVVERGKERRRLYFTGMLDKEKNTTVKTKGER